MSLARLDRATQPTLRSALVQPRSLGLLALTVLVAVVFALLSHWQISRAIESGTVVARPTETVRALTVVAQPQSQQTDASVGQLVRTSGRLVPSDTVVVGDRLNDGHSGYWVVGHALVDEPAGAQLAVALGWTADRDTADAAARRIRDTPAADGPLLGRYVDSDPAVPSNGGPAQALSAVSTAQLINIWRTDVDGPVYEGILTLRDAPAGLTPIYSPRPGSGVELNLLNVLYAVEWTVFAGAAFYVWYRLVRDRWELERAEALGEDELEDEFDDA